MIGVILLIGFWLFVGLSLFLIAISGGPREARELLRDRPVVIVDDGLATGRSMAVALETAQRAGAARLIVAVPVASGPGFRELEGRCEAYALAVVEPPEFLAVGQFYDDFAQVEDSDVVAVLGGR